MSKPQVQFHENASAFSPGDQARGTASWHLDSQPRAIEIRLCWLTQGIGIPEAHVIETVSIEHPALDGTQSFAFRLPEGPLSYLGALSAVVWAVEVVVLPSQQCARAVFCVSHTGHPLLLGQASVGDQEDVEYDS